MALPFLFVLGLMFGSFLNVIALRYDGDHFLFDPKIIGGRSHCPVCLKTLQWFELIPLVSFFIQKAKCRNCRTRIGIQYPIIEFLTGCMFVAVAARLAELFGGSGLMFWILAAFWILLFFLLILISYIDIRLGIIPDECHAMLGALAVAIIAIFSLYSNGVNISFFGSYASLFGFQQNIWIAHLVGMAVSFAFFEVLVLVTRGRGMGMGDVKLALPLGFLFGWPDILFIVVAAFVIGAVVGVIQILLKKKTMEGTLPFVPFFVVGCAFVFFFGLPFVQWYLKVLGL